MIDAMVISVQEPQLDRCLEAVRNQDPDFAFSRIVHLDSIVPESEAVNRGLEMIDNEWVMNVGGDMILYPDATKKVLAYMQKDASERICAYYFGLRDTFLKCDMGFCGVLKTSVFGEVKRKDKLSGDLNVNIELRKRGLVIRKLLDQGIIIGTHFDKPDAFQVFKRFYCAGARANDNAWNLMTLREHFEETDDPLYLLAINAISFAKARGRSYVGSRNVEFDRKLFEEFKNGTVGSHCHPE
jgi:hypothetical protein